MRLSGGYRILMYKILLAVPVDDVPLDDVPVDDVSDIFNKNNCYHMSADIMKSSSITIGVWCEKLNKDVFNLAG